jgi:AsmA family
MALGLIAPLINAAKFSGPVQRAVEGALGRRIQFSKVHLTLFSGPGFSLENVSIAEDPRYGSEPFAWVPTLHASLRIDKLLLGQFRLSTLRLEEPSLNLVKRSDGTWNVVELVQRLSAPRHTPLNLFPALEVSDGRIDFKFGARKTTFYILDADFSVYPERSGKLYVQFSGSPARTDRAGNGFGHLRGTAKWYLDPPSPGANQLEADVTLDPSNLSEIATLVEGEDIGVHGSIGGRARVAGPLAALRVSGALRLGDVHRWDLLPSSGEVWRVEYSGAIDWGNQRLNIHTAGREGEATAVALELSVDNLLTHPGWSLLARLDRAPVEKLLPLGRRMGLALPENLEIQGAMQGTIAYSNSTGLGGTVSISNASATMPNVPPLHAQVVTATVFPDRIHFDPAVIDTPEGNLRAGGDYYLSSSRSIAALNVTDFSVDALKNTVGAWFGTPSELALLNGGRMDGTFNYLHQQPAPPDWSGQFQFTDSTLQPDGVAVPLEKAEGQVAFDASSVDVTRFSGRMGQEEIRASYRYSASAKRPERLRLEMANGDLVEFEKALEPALTAQDLLTRLHVTKRTIPAWLAARNMEGDIAVNGFSVNGTPLGPMATHFVWQGANLQFPAVQINLPEGLIRGYGSVNLASYTPRSRFNARVSGFPWRGGVLSADGTFDTSGIGTDALQNLRASGTFAGADLNLSAEDAFSRISGQFEISFTQGWPDLKLSAIQASDGLDAWNGNASSQSDGKLIIDLEHAGRQRRVVSTITPETATTVSALSPVQGERH